MYLLIGTRKGRVFAWVLSLVVSTSAYSMYPKVDSNPQCTEDGFLNFSMIEKRRDYRVLAADDKNETLITGVLSTATINELLIRLDKVFADLKTKYQLTVDNIQIEKRGHCWHWRATSTDRLNRQR